jgi:hypothetical protein
MQGHVSRILKLPLPKAFLAMLGFVGSVESCVRRHSLDFASEWLADRQWVAQRLRDQTRNCEILCLGDSQVKFGVLPSILEQCLGIQSFNLAMHGGQPQEAFYLLRRFLRAGGKPSTIVVDFKPWLLAQGVETRLESYAGLLDIEECIDLSWEAGDQKLFGALLARKAVPSFSAREDLLRGIREALRGSSTSEFWTILTRFRNWNRNLGAQVMPEKEYCRVPLASFPHLSRRWSCRPLCERYVWRFLELARASGVLVVYLLPPIEPGLQSHCERSGFDADHLRFVRGLRESYPNLLVVDGRHAGYDTPALCDPTHLNRVGAIVLTQDLAEFLAEALKHPTTAGGWVELPRFAVPATTAGVEDLDASIVALRQAAHHRGR